MVKAHSIDSDLSLDMTVRGSTAPVTVDAAGAPTPGTAVDFNLDDYVGYTWGSEDHPKPIIGLDGVVAHIDSGAHLSPHNGTITYSFTSLDHLTGVYNNKHYGFGAPDGFSPFSAAQQDTARASIQLWDDLIAPKFVEKNGMGADIQFGNSADPAQAYSYYPSNKTGIKYHSDVFVADPALNESNAWLDLSGYGATTITHELGHTIGLSHPGAYNYDPALDLNYDNYAEYAQDSEQYSIMSYWDATNTNSYIVDWSTFFFSNEQTPLLHDILTVQQIYGADPTTRAGDTVYGFNSTAGNAVYDFAHNPFPYLSIYDAGGNDTIDLSGFNAGVYLDLHAGEFSSAGQGPLDAATVNAARDHLSAEAPDFFGPLSHLTQAQINGTMNSYRAFNASSIAGDTGVTGVNATETNNISIAYGTTIENGIGGSARDVIWGNEVANVLKGMGGNDVLDGFEGNDTLYGGAGSDTFQFHNLEKGDTIADFATGVDHIDVSAFGFTTWLGNGAFTVHAGELRYDHSVLSGDLNGDGVADFAVTVHGSDVVVGDLIV